MKTMIGIFQGKEATYNKFLLETLYNNGLLTAWELTKLMRTENRMSLHAIFNKRLRILEKKGYVQKVGKKWMPSFKGFIAVLIIQSEPKPWNEQYNKIVGNHFKKNKVIVKDKNDKRSYDITKFVKRIPVIAGDFERLVKTSDEVKKLMEKGIINLDVIKNKTLLMVIVTELGD